MKLGKPLVKIPTEHAENGFKILCHVLNKYERQQRMDEHQELLVKISRLMTAFMVVRLDEALTLAREYAVLEFMDWEPKPSLVDKDKRKAVMRMTEKMRLEEL